MQFPDLVVFSTQGVVPSTRSGMFDASFGILCAEVYVPELAEDTKYYYVLATLDYKLHVHVCTATRLLDLITQGM